jgi:hypothetical protein
MAKAWEKTIIGPLTGGYNTSVPPSALQPGQSPKVHNMVFDQGRVETDTGYDAYGSTVTGTPRLTYAYRKKSGVTEIILITNSTVYKWNAGEWQYLASSVATTVNGAEAAGQTVITVTDSTGFTDGDVIGIILDNGTQHQTTVNGAPAGNDITITDAIPVGRSAPNATPFIEAVSLSGVDTSPVTADTFPADDVMIFTNDKDNVKYYDGTTCTDVPNLVTAVGGGNCYAKVVRVKDNKIILFNTNENGTDFPQRVRWSAVGDYTDWTTANDAGYEDLYDAEDPIRGAERVGPYIIVYRAKSGYRMEYVGQTDLIYFFQRSLESDGAAGAMSIISRDNVNVVMGENRFYIYAGGMELQNFGEEIWNEIFGPNGNISVLYKTGVTAVYLENSREFVFFVPSDEESLPSKVWRYSVEHQAWASRTFDDTIINGAVVSSVDSVSWSEATGNWEDAKWGIGWNDVSLSSTQISVLMCGKDAGTGNPQVYEYSDSYTTDDDTAITGEFQTHELFLPEDKIRVNRIVAKAKGDAITVKYSVDEGVTWTTYGTLAPGDYYDEQSVWKQLVVDRVMFQFTGAQFGLDRVTVEWKPESRY